MKKRIISAMLAAAVLGGAATELIPMAVHAQGVESETQVQVEMSEDCIELLENGAILELNGVNYTMIDGLIYSID